MSTVDEAVQNRSLRGGSFGRFFTVCLTDLSHHARRPLFLIWALILIVGAWGMSTGSVRIQSGDATVGGTKSWITSEFAVAMQLSLLTTLFYTFFLSVSAGTTILQDEEWRLGEVIHSTPLRPSEYVWGKFTAVLIGALAMLIIQLLAMGFFFHILPNSDAVEFRGPFQIRNYIRPALLFSVPTVIFLGGIAFAIGEWSRRVILVFLLPVGILMVQVFFLWTWSPGWLDPRINQMLMLVDPAGFRWLTETWLKVDRGVAFYNTATLAPDFAFVVSRLVFIGIGLAAIGLSQWHFARTLRGRTRVASRSRPLQGEAPADLETLSSDSPSLPSATKAKTRNEPVGSAARSLSALKMSTVRPGLWSGAWHVARSEIQELRSSPGLYLFVPLILLQVLGGTLVQVGFLDSPLLITAGTFAVSSMGELATCVCLLLLFYTVESLDREQRTRLAAISSATPIRTGSLLIGKALAQAVVGTAIVAAVGLAGFIAVLIQGQVPLETRPVALVWGLILFPTFLAWTSFVMAVWSITRNRYTTYALALGVLCFTGYRLLTNQINWVGNWPLWEAIRWSDISVFELDRRALVLSRVLALGLTVFLLALTVRFFRRREPDPIRTLQRLRPLPLMRATARLTPYAAIPLVAGTLLALDISRGHEGGLAKKQAKDYWRKNLATYRDAKVPDIAHVDLDLELFPATGQFRAAGAFDLVNRSETPLREILMTGGLDWKNLAWTRDDKPVSPTDRAHLFVFPLDTPLGTGQSTRIGFRHEGTFPSGISKRGGGTSEFVLPSGVVLTSFRPSFVPAIGYLEEAGIEDDNRYDAKEYPDGFFEGQTDSMLGSRAPFTTRITLTGPADFTLNSVGTKVAETVENGKRRVTWESDHPVSFFNVVAGRWDVKRGTGTAVFYHPGHPYNVDEIVESLDAARKYYSEWFYPFPWKELKLSEFANLASYAQGFPTDITFSEGIGFLTKSTPENHAAFEITAHEAAHQWWGNILVPGKGPGAVILAEGMAHYSTILLVEQVKGLGARIDFCKRLEDKYAKGRKTDSERPLVKTDGSRPSDTTVIYDRGSWVFWMLTHHMGRARTLEGIQAFIRKYQGNPDHPVLQDFLAQMRPFAADPGAFDAFTKQWFLEVALPEYRIHDQAKSRKGDGWEVTARVENIGTGTMPVDVAAIRGERFDAKGKDSADYLESRSQVTLGPGESKTITITGSFDPEMIVIDPDAKVLQLRRKTAEAKF